jgi:hypothetical protein
MALIADKRAAAAQLYVFQRNANFSLFIYSKKLKRWETINTAISLSLILFASGGAIAGWQMWKSKGGAWVWGVVTAINLVATLCKPVIDPVKRVSRYSKLCAAYTEACSDLDSAIHSMERSLDFTAEVDSARKKAEARFSALKLQDDVRISKKMEDDAKDFVDKKFPVAKMWLPPIEIQKSDAVHGGA